MTKQTQETPWAYQNASELADDLSEQAVDLTNAIAEEETPDDLLTRVDKIERVIEDLRAELDEMPRF